MRLQIPKDSGCAPGILRRGGCPSHLVTSLLSLLSSRWSLRLSRYPKGTSSILPDGRIPGRMGKAGAPRSPPVSGGRSKCSWRVRSVAGRISFINPKGRENRAERVGPSARHPHQTARKCRQNRALNRYSRKQRCQHKSSRPVNKHLVKYAWLTCLK